MTPRPGGQKGGRDRGGRGERRDTDPALKPAEPAAEAPEAVEKAE